MSDEKDNMVTPSVMLGHELGHARARMTGRNGAAKEGESQNRKPDPCEFIAQQTVEPVKRTTTVPGSPPANAVSPTPRARCSFPNLFLGLTPQALCCRPRRGLLGERIKLLACAIGPQNEPHNDKRRSPKDRKAPFESLTVVRGPRTLSRVDHGRNVRAFNKLYSPLATLRLGP